MDVALRAFEENVASLPANRVSEDRMLQAYINLLEEHYTIRASGFFSLAKLYKDYAKRLQDTQREMDDLVAIVPGYY